MALQQQSTFVCGHLDTSAERSQPAPTVLRVGGAVEHEQLLTLEALRAMPTVTVTVPDRGDSQAAARVYTGVLLRDVLQHAGVPDNTTRNNDTCGKYVAVIADDGYCVTLAYCDLLAPFSQQQAMLAYEVDNQPAHNLTDVGLILPDDPIACRSAKHVIEILLGDPRSHVMRDAERVMRDA